MPFKVSEYLLDRIPENMSNRIADRMPEDMPDKVPECLPDRMPEDMPDRMSDDLPVTKRINVMVGITRSKVFFFARCERAAFSQKAVRKNGERRNE
jgi:hypothetical protein